MIMTKILQFLLMAMIMAELLTCYAHTDKEGFIIVYPQGVGRHWNDGRKGANDRAHKENIDDVGFISLLIDRLVTEWNINPARIYVTGISNGAGMSFMLACHLSKKITAIAPV